jgi:hypothetical protein
VIFLCLGCFETDGKLCAISPGFFINTFLGLKSVFGEKTGWTFDEYFDMEKNLSDGNVMIYNSNKEEFLRSCLMNYMEQRYRLGEWNLRILTIRILCNPKSNKCC